MPEDFRVLDQLRYLISCSSYTISFMCIPLLLDTCKVFLHYQDIILLDARQVIMRHRKRTMLIARSFAYTLCCQKQQKKSRNAPIFQGCETFFSFQLSKMGFYHIISSHDTLYWLYIVLSCLDIVVEFHSFYVILFFLKVFATKLQPLS